MEFASIFSSFGAKVTVVEMLPEILPMLDEEIVQILKGVLLRKGVVFHTNSKVVGVEKKGKGLAVRVETPAGPLVPRRGEGARLRRPPPRYEGAGA